MNQEGIVKIVAYGGTEHAIIVTGLEMALIRARGAYVRGQIEVEDFEAEVDRIMRKRQRLYSVAA